MNLGISLLLVKNFGLIGIAIGTLISVLVRCIEFIIFTSRNILDRTILKTFIRVTISIIQLVLIVIINNYIVKYNEFTYIEWGIKAMEVFMISIIIVIPLNLVYYKQEFKESLEMLKIIIKGSARK